MKLKSQFEKGRRGWGEEPERRLGMKSQIEKAVRDSIGEEDVERGG